MIVQNKGNNFVKQEAAVTILAICIPSDYNGLNVQDQKNISHKVFKVWTGYKIRNLIKTRATAL